jgi:hypothetical protein
MKRFILYLVNGNRIRILKETKPKNFANNIYNVTNRIIKTFITFDYLMKKAAAIFIICIYAISSLGFSVKEFYCCGKLKSVTLSLHEDGSKACSKSESKGKCCKTKFQYLKVKNSHLASTILVNASNDFQFQLPFTSLRAAKIFGFVPVIDANRSHAPPLHPGIAVYISNCVYRI